MKLKLAIGSAVIICALFFTQVPSAFAQTASEIQAKIEETRREREALVREQARLKAELEAISKQGQTFASAVKSLDATRRKLATDIRITESKISSTSLNIGALENSLDQKGRQIDIHRQAIAATIQALADYDARPFVLDLLSSAQLSDVWGRGESLGNIGGKLSEEIDALRETRAILGQQKEEKERNVEELKDLSSQLGGQKQVVEVNKSAQEKLLAQTKSKEAEYQRMIANLEAKRKEFDNELFQFENALKILIDPTSYPAPQAGLLAWPVDYVYVTQRFGVTGASGRLYASGSHNGVDFRAPMGTAVRAALGGVVEGTGNTDEQNGCYSYGGWILVRHPNGLSTVYAHLSSRIVRAGQSVETGQVIGYSGGTPGTNGAGYSTGPHLHLGLFASQGVEIRQFTQSRGCKQVFVPIADTKAYLDPLVYLPR